MKTHVDVFERLKQECSTMTLAQLAATIRKLRDDLDEKSAVKAEAQKLYDQITISIVPERMEEEEVETMKVENVGRLQVKADIRCSCPAGNRENLYKWLKEHGHEALVQSAVNSSSLKAFVKEQMKEGNDYPKTLLKIDPYSRATVTRA